MRGAGLAGHILEKKICRYMRASTVTTSIPDAYENYEGLQGFLDLDFAHDPPSSPSPSQAVGPDSWQGRERANVLDAVHNIGSILTD